MPNTAPSQSLAINQKRTVHFKVFRPSDGLEDLTSPVALATNQPAVATIAIDPTDPRAAIITAASQTGNCAVSVDTVPPSPTPLVIPVTVTAPVDYSHVDFVGADAPVPK